MQTMQAKFQAVYVLMQMLRCHIPYIYIYTHDYIYDYIYDPSDYEYIMLIRHIY